MDTETGDGGRASGNRDPRRDQSPPHAGVALTRLGSPDREHIHVPQSVSYTPGRCIPGEAWARAIYKYNFHMCAYRFSSLQSPHTHTPASCWLLRVVLVACVAVFPGCGRCAIIEHGWRLRSFRARTGQTYFPYILGRSAEPGITRAQCGACRWPDLM